MEDISEGLGAIVSRLKDDRPDTKLKELFL